MQMYIIFFIETYVSLWRKSACQCWKEHWQWHCWGPHCLFLEPGVYISKDISVTLEPLREYKALSIFPLKRLYHKGQVWNFPTYAWRGKPGRSPKGDSSHYETEGCICCVQSHLQQCHGYLLVLSHNRFKLVLHFLRQFVSKSVQWLSY